VIYVCVKTYFWSQSSARLLSFWACKHLNASFRNSVLEQYLICDMMWLQAVIGEYRSKLSFM